MKTFTIKCFQEAEPTILNVYLKTLFSDCCYLYVDVRLTRNVKSSSYYRFEVF